jgi:hypothetical protein
MQCRVVQGKLTPFAVGTVTKPPSLDGCHLDVELWMPLYAMLALPLG